MSPLSLTAPQATAIFLLHLAWFGALLPALWVDKGFPALLELLDVRSVRLGAFGELAASGGGNHGYLPFAATCAALHTAVVVAALLLAGRCKRACSGSGVLAAAGCVAGIAALYAATLHLFAFTFTAGWGHGFDWAYFFFSRDEPAAANNFGRVVAMSFCVEAAAACAIRVCTRTYHGLYPSFATHAIPKILAAFLCNCVLFRHVISPRVMRSLAAASGLVGMDSSNPETAATVLDNLNMNEWAALAAAMHTLCLALGMTFYLLTNDVLSSACTDACRKKLQRTVVSALRFAVTFCAAAAFFQTIQMWLAYAGAHGMEFVEKTSRLGYFDVTVHGSNVNYRETVAPSASAVAVATGSYTIAFLVGCLLAEGPTKYLPLPDSCTQRCAAQLAACSSRNLRLRPVRPFKGKVKTRVAGWREPLLLAGAAIVLALYVADHNLLGHHVVEVLAAAQRTLGQWRAAGPAAWNYLTKHYTRDQLFFMTLPVLLVSEIPLWFFTVLDLLKLRCADKYRIHYSKVEKKRPRLYPTKAELWKAFKVHCVNFFGLYCGVFLVGVGAACKTNIIPYSFAKELPAWWLPEFLLCSFAADVLFYVFHRAVHSKGLYVRLHKMHHEWIYTIALAHHYMDPLEAAIFMLPPIIPPMLLGSHITIVWAMVILTQLGGILGHSAFMIPVLSNKYTKWIPFINSEYHDLHHLRFNVNYGAVWPVVDRIFGTYREEPIVYLDGIEPELTLTMRKKSAAGATAGSMKEGDVHTSASKVDHRGEEELIDGDDVADSAEGASKEGALPELPWYMRWLPTDQSNFIAGKTSKID